MLDGCTVHIWRVESVQTAVCLPLYTSYVLPIHRLGNPTSHQLIQPCQHFDFNMNNMSTPGSAKYAAKDFTTIFLYHATLKSFVVVITIIKGKVLTKDEL